MEVSDLIGITDYPALGPDGEKKASPVPGFNKVTTKTKS
jgi:hypothetical protein